MQFGTISRFEADKINPTKETLTRISKTLNLGYLEHDYLIGIRVGRVSQKEIQEACQYLQPYLNSTQNPIHISDDTWFVHDWNKAQSDLFEVTSAYAEKFRHMSTIEMLFNPKLPVKSGVPKEYWPIIATYQIAFFRREVDLWQNESWYKELLKRLTTYQDFSRFWQESESLDVSKIDPHEKVFIYQGSQKTPQKFYIADHKVHKFPRFVLIEYVPT